MHTKDNSENTTSQDNSQTTAGAEDNQFPFANDSQVNEFTETEATQSLQQKIEELERKAADLQDAYLRAKADNENTRRRAQEDISKAHKYAVENFAESIVTVKDSLEISLKLENITVEALKEGVEATLKQLNTAFEKHRLIEVNPTVGEKLDPMKHQAISTVPADQESNTIVTVLQKGYTISDRLLRPALVTVASHKPA